MKHTTEQAFAKINLSLDVTGKRENGYHEIDGVMQSVTLCDVVTVDFEVGEATSVTLTAEGNPDMPTDERNLAYKAALRLLEAARVTGEVKLHIQKRIPMAGGLAGGSTDGAAVLRGLNRLLPSPLSLDELCAIGAKLGAGKIELKIKVGEGGRAFGAVSTKEISAAIKEQMGYDVDKKKIQLKDAIKTLGTHDVAIKLHPKVTASLKVIVTEQ